MKPSNPKQKSQFDLNEFIKEWNIKYPYDYWWRKKYNIPFGSEAHKSMSHINMAFEYKEEIYFKRKAEVSVVKEFERDEVSLISNIVAFKHRDLVTQQSTRVTDKEFDDLDLRAFDDIKKVE